MAKKGFKRPNEGAKIDGPNQSPKKFKPNGQPPQKQQKPKFQAIEGKKNQVTATEKGKKFPQKTQQLVNGTKIQIKTNEQVKPAAKPVEVKKPEVPKVKNIKKEEANVIVTEQKSSVKNVGAAKPAEKKKHIFSEEEKAEHHEAIRAKMDAKKKAAKEKKIALRKEKRSKDGQYKPEVVNLSAEQLSAKIEDIRSRGKLTTTAKRKLAVLLKKRSIMEGTYVKTEPKGPQMTATTKRKLRRLNTIIKKESEAKENGEVPDKSEENTNIKKEKVEPAKIEKKNIVAKVQVQKKAAPVIVKNEQVNGKTGKIMKGKNINKPQQKSIESEDKKDDKKDTIVNKKEKVEKVKPEKKNIVAKVQEQKKVAPVVVKNEKINGKSGKMMKGKNVIQPQQPIESEDDEDSEEEDDDEEEIDSTLNTSADVSMEQEDDSDDDDDSEEEEENSDTTLNTSADVSMDQDEDESDDDEEEEEEKEEIVTPKVQAKPKKQQPIEKTEKFQKKPQTVEKTEDSDKKPQQNKGPQDAQKKTRYVLFVGNLPYDIKADDIKKQFLTKVSDVQSVRIPLKHDNSPRGFAYVEFTNSTDYEKGLSLHNTILNGRKMVVQYSEGGSKKVGNRPNVVAKNQKLHALRKQGKLAGSVKDTNKRNFRRNKKEAA